jgi:hypothetical protein
MMFASGLKPHEVNRQMGHTSVSITGGICTPKYSSDYNEQIAQFEA